MSGTTRCLFVTGTDTGVGKTRVSVRLLDTLRSLGIRAAGFKPVLSGESRDDADQLFGASHGSDSGALTIDEVNPVWLKIPAAPLSARIAGEAAAGEIDACRILDTFEALAIRHEALVIEGAGGWDVPIDETRSFADLAAQLRAPVLLVAANRLGVLNHTRLTVRAIEAAGLELAGILLNEIAPPDPDDVARQVNLETLRLSMPGVPFIEPMGWEESDPFPEKVLGTLLDR